VSQSSRRNDLVYTPSFSEGVLPSSSTKFSDYFPPQRGKKGDGPWIAKPEQKRFDLLEYPEDSVKDAIRELLVSVCAHSGASLNQIVQGLEKKVVPANRWHNKHFVLRSVSRHPDHIWLNCSVRIKGGEQMLLPFSIRCSELGKLFRNHSTAAAG
jgi:hypothetical protein